MNGMVILLYTATIQGGLKLLKLNEKINANVGKIDGIYRTVKLKPGERKHDASNLSDTMKALKEATNDIWVKDNTVGTLIKKLKDDLLTEEPATEEPATEVPATEEPATEAELNQLATILTKEHSGTNEAEIEDIHPSFEVEDMTISEKKIFL